MRPEELDKLLLNLETRPSESLDRRIAALIALAAKQGSGTVSPRLALWGYIMQSKIAKIAAAIIIVLVGVAVFHTFGSAESVTWAGVIHPLMTAQTAVFDVVADYQGTTTEAKLMVMGPRIRYELKASQGTPILVFDTEHLQMLTLIPDRKLATLVDLKNLPDKTPENYLRSIRDVIKELQNDPSATIEPLPGRVIDGQNAVGFHARNARDEVTVWADSETLLPIRLEQTRYDLNVVCTNFQFDVELDPSLFSMDIPADYSTRSGQLDVGKSLERDLVEGLRIWAQVLEDNQFPEAISIDVYMKAMPGLSQRLRDGTLTLSHQQKLDMGLNMNRLFQFVASLKPEQDWQYVGASVPFGDASRPVCWYKPIGSETYRVFYGDLSIRDCLKDDLPK